MNDIIKMIEAIASYMERKDESPVCAKDLRRLILLVQSMEKLADKYNYEVDNNGEDIYWNCQEDAEMTPWEYADRVLQSIKKDIFNE